jgi:Ni/Co efflux regulator RcnB
MKISALASVVVAVSLLAGPLAFAQGNGNRPNRDLGDARQRSEQTDRRDENASANRGRGRANGRDRRDERGAGPDRAFYRGDRLPFEYRSKQYVVDDWRGHRLSAPPRGYHWVQTGGDYVLVAIATGVILQLLLN